MPIQLQNHRTSNAKLLSAGSSLTHGKQKLHTAASLQQAQKNNLKVRKNESGSGTTMMKRMFANPTNATPNLPDAIPDRDCNPRRQNRRRHSIGTTADTSSSMRCSTSSSRPSLVETTTDNNYSSLRSSISSTRPSLADMMDPERSTSFSEEISTTSSRDESNTYGALRRPSSTTSMRRMISLNDIIGLDDACPDLTTTDGGDDDETSNIGLDMDHDGDDDHIIEETTSAANGTAAQDAQVAATITCTRRRGSSKSRISLDDVIGLEDASDPTASDDRTGDDSDLRRSRRRRSNNTGGRGSRTSKSPLRSILGFDDRSAQTEGNNDSRRHTGTTRNSRTSKSPMRRISLNDVIGLEDASNHSRGGADDSSHRHGGGSTNTRRSKASKSPMRRILGSFDDRSAQTEGADTTRTRRKRQSKSPMRRIC